MRVRLDDDLYRVDRTYLGPRGKPLPVRATYTQWALFFGVLAVSGIGLRLLRLSMGPTFGLLLTQLVVWVLACWAVAWYLRRFMTADRPLIDELMRIGQELTARRPAKPRTQHVRMVASVQVWEPWSEPAPRWHLRLRWWAQRQVGRLTRPVRELVEPILARRQLARRTKSTRSQVARRTDKRTPWLIKPDVSRQENPTQPNPATSDEDAARTELVEERA